MASLSELFSLVTLPRISDIELRQKAVVSKIHLTQQGVLDIGLSRSAICSYVLKPTPKLIWTYALAPTTIIDSIDVAEFNGGQTKQFAVGLTERKRGYKLMFLQKQERIAEVVEQEVNGDVDDVTVEEEQKILTRTIKTSAKVISTHFNKTKDHVYAVLEDSTVQVFKHTFSEGEEKEEDEIHTNLTKTNNAKVIYHQYISAGATSDDGVLLLVELVNKKKVQVRLISLELAHSVEVKNIVLESAYQGAGTKYTFEPLSNVLYELNDKTLKLYSLPNFKLSKTISFGNRFLGQSNTAKEQQQVSLAAPAPDRLLISYGNSIYIVNTKYESILDEFRLKTSNISLQSVVHVKGKSINTSETMAVYLSHDEKINVSELNVINVNVGLGSLSESLGKGIASPSVNATTTSIAAPHGVADLLDENFVEQSNHLTKELKEIYKELENASTNQNLKKWERIVIPYLKGESWETISKSIKKIRPEKGQQKQQTVAKDYEFKVFEVEKDRIIDYNFIHSITSLIFKVEAGEVCFNNTFIPEHSLTYLFTHPLYPKEFTNGLLLLFSRRAEEIEEDGKNGIGSLRLLRQALITCPNLSCLEIAKQLNNSNDEIFQDVVSRLVEEYSVNQISSTLLDILNGANSKLNLEECIKKCYILDNGWEIMPAIIDAGGLFGWSKGLINKIIEDVELQLESLNLNTYNLTFTNQAILVNSALDNATGTTHGKKSKKSKKKAKKEQQHQQNLSNGNSIDFDLNDIIESNKQQDQLNSILTINNTSRKNLLDDGISLSKKIPVYSVEKLIL